VDEDHQRPQVHRLRARGPRRPQAPQHALRGTQHGVFYSYDDGDTWHSLSLNLPDVQVSDLWVEDSDLAIATHGRSFYILDDIGPLRQFGPQFTTATDMVLFAPDDPIRSYRTAAIKYWVKKPASAVTIEVIDPKGTVVRTFTNVPASAAGAAAAGPQQVAVEVEAAVVAEAGAAAVVVAPLACRWSPATTP
jgi:hypothetical protein